MSTAIAKPNGTSTPQALALICNHYHYDQLNRIKSQISYTGTSASSYASLGLNGEYDNTFTYDAAGNISTQLRDGTTAPGQSMDDLDYFYYTTTGGTYTMTATGGAPTNGTNKLAYVDDAGTAGNYTDDLEDQSAGNYTYDAIGNLITDSQEEIDDISWNVYGKIQTITRKSASTKSDLVFIYDSFGQRIGKIVKTRNGSGYKDQDEWLYTYYVRDASGNVMATYTRSYTEVDEYVEDKLKLSETHLYGGSRLGIKDRTVEDIYSSVLKTYSGITNGAYDITGISSYTTMNDVDLATPERELGNKMYEFSNHLGNVLVTLADRKTQVQSGASVSYFMSDVRSYSDYSAFGAPMPGRNASSNQYRYGLNGQEKDNEIIEGVYTAEFWEYDSRLGRRWNEDPVVNPMMSSYCAFENNPIYYADPDGDVVDPGTKGTKEYRQNRWSHFWHYRFDKSYRKQYDDLNARPGVYHMRRSDDPSVNPLGQGGTITNTGQGEFDWEYNRGNSSLDIEVRNKPGSRSILSGIYNIGKWFKNIGFCQGWGLYLGLEGGGGPEGTRTSGFHWFTIALGDYKHYSEIGTRRGALGGPSYVEMEKKVDDSRYLYRISWRTRNGHLNFISYWSPINGKYVRNKLASGTLTVATTLGQAFGTYHLVKAIKYAINDMRGR